MEKYPPTPRSSLKDYLFDSYRSHRKSFSRANFTAMAATFIDFSTLYCLVELAHLYYVISTACGALAGAVTNFALNRTWAFNSRHQALRAQGIRYAIVSGVSLLLNTGLVFCFTEFGHLRYLHSKIIAALVVGWSWNYPLHRYFVFPPQTDQ